MVYIIDRKRLQLEYDRNLKGKAQGVMNWFISPEGVLNLYIDIYGVTYLYKTPIDKIDNILKMMLNPNMSILGIKEDLEQKKKDENQRLENLNIQSRDFYFNPGDDL